MKSERFIVCQYCDDVRYEVDGKISLIGIYAGGLQVNGTLPITIHKLFVVCQVGTPTDQPFMKLDVVIRHDDAELLTAAVPPEVLAEQQSNVLQDDTRGFMALLAFPLPPVVVEKSGKISVTFFTEAGELRANALRIQIPASSAS